MQHDVHLGCRAWHVPHAARYFLHARSMLLFSLLITGCGGGDSAPPSTAAPQQASSGLGPLAAQGTPPGGEKSAPLGVVDEPPVPSTGSAKMVQLSALPHLSSLSDRERAGLLMLLPSKSASQRLALINMYPSLVKLPEQQKELLLDKLEKIVPVTVSERQ